MSWHLLFDNFVAYSLQIGMLVGVAAVIPTALRLRQPGAKLLYWQILLAVCVLLPLQPWKQAASGGTGQVTAVVTSIRAVPSTPAMHLPPRGEIVMLVMMLGVAIRLVWLAAGFWKLRRYRRHSVPLDPAPAWSVEALLRVSDDIAAPVTFGWRKPVVLLPANFPALDGSVQEAILCHEIMHVRRNDWLFTVVEEAIRAIFWFHPAIWWLLGEIGLAREQEVDRLAIEITREREQYMDALLAIAGASAQLDLAPAPLFLRKRHLKHRVILIVQEARMSKARVISTLSTGFAVVAAACWLAAGSFPLTAQPQAVNDAAGVSVFLNGSQVLHRTPVHYPARALRDGVQGMVTVELKLDASGNVSDAHVLSGPEELRSSTLQAVLDWHFTHDAAGGVRDVQVSFELPKMAGVTGGVVGGVTGGVVGGVTGGVEGRPFSSVTVTGRSPMQLPTRVQGIRVMGLSDESRAALVATLPVHVGDEFTPDTMAKTSQAVQAFDEHLKIARSFDQDGLTLMIAPGMMAPPPPPPPPPPTEVSNENPPSRIKVGGNLQSVNILRKVPPVYPELAKSAGVQGVVHLAVLIGKDGTVQEIHSMGGPALLIQTAMDAVKQWVYRPTLLNGEPVSVETTVDVNFTLSQ
jgi:TonB family protein